MFVVIRGRLNVYMYLYAAHAYIYAISSSDVANKGGHVIQYILPQTFLHGIYNSLSAERTSCETTDCV